MQGLCHRYSCIQGHCVWCSCLLGLYDKCSCSCLCICVYVLTNLWDNNFCDPKSHFLMLCLPFTLGFIRPCAGFSRSSRTRLVLSWTFSSLHFSFFLPNIFIHLFFHIF
ncbi:hypothetical protein FKM82_025933 [Ascaphus truei]